MKVLFVSPVVPWRPDSGGRLRTFKLLKYLAPHAEVHLRSVRQPGLAADAEEELSAHVASVKLFERGRPGPVRRLTRTRPERWFHSPQLERHLAAELEQGDWDLVHLDEPLLARSLPRRTRIPVSVHHHKLDTLLHARMAGDMDVRHELEGLRLARMEAVAARRHRHHVLCSADDARALSSRHPGLDCQVIPNGFDADYLAPCLRAPRRSRERLLFLGTMSYGPNVDGLGWMVREILPRIRARCPQVVLDVVGRDPSDEVRALAGERVRIHGGVEDVRPAIESTAAFVAPLRIGGGTRVKLIEALALRAPVVSTSAAAEGLELLDREHLLLAEGAEGFARATLELLEDQALAERLGRAGRRQALRHYTWDGLAAELAAWWRSLVGQQQLRRSA